MSSKETFKSIEKRAYFISQKDGLFELFTGLILIGLFFSQILSTLNIEMPASLIIPILPVSLTYWVVKRFIIAPRMGVVRFGPTRKRLLKRLLYFTVIVVGFQVVGLLFLKFGFFNMNLNNDLLIACLLSFVLIFIPISLIAYFKDYWPAYLVAIVSSLTWPSTIFVSHYIGLDNYVKYVFLFPGLIFSTWGIITLISFLKKNPKTR